MGKGKYILLCGSGWTYDGWPEEFDKWSKFEGKSLIYWGPVWDDLISALADFEHADKFLLEYGWSKKDSNDLFENLRVDLLSEKPRDNKCFIIYQAGFPKDYTSLHQHCEIKAVVWNLMNPWDTIAQRHLSFSSRTQQGQIDSTINMENLLKIWMTDWMNELSAGFQLKKQFDANGLQFHIIRMEQIFGSMQDFRQQLATLIDSLWPQMNTTECDEFKSKLNQARKKLPLNWNEEISRELSEISLQIGYPASEILQ